MQWFSSSIDQFVHSVTDFPFAFAFGARYGFREWFKCFAFLFLSPLFSEYEIHANKYSVNCIIGLCRPWYAISHGLKLLVCTIIFNRLILWHYSIKGGSADQSCLPRCSAVFNYIDVSPMIFGFIPGLSVESVRGCQIYVLLCPLEICFDFANNASWTGNMVIRQGGWLQIEALIVRILR